MVQKAKVLSVQDNGIAEILVERESACGHDCGSCAGCGLRAAPIKTYARNTKGACVGDTVEIESESRKVLFFAGAVYLLPLILFFAAYFIVYAISGLDASAMTAGAIGFVLGIAGAVLLNHREAEKNTVSFTIVRVLR